MREPAHKMGRDKDEGRLTDHDREWEENKNTKRKRK